MLYLHDVYVNWVDGGSRKHEIPEYFEWKDEDPTEFLDTVPLIIVEPEFFSVLEDGYVDIPTELLSMVHRVTVKINPDTKRKNKVDYCFVMTDRVRVMVINTEGDNKPNLKSRLAVRNELYVLDLAADEDYKPYRFTIEPDEYEVADNSSLEEKMLSVGPEVYVGLTRVEREMKTILMDCLFNLSTSDNKAEVYYWFIELFPDLYHPTTYAASTNKYMVEEIFNFLKVGWGTTHVEYGTNLVKVEPNKIYKEDWASLVKEAKRKDKVESK